MVRITGKHTASYCDKFLGYDIFRANDPVARMHRAKSNLVMNSKSILKLPWNPTVLFCNLDNTCDAFPIE